MIFSNIYFKMNILKDNVRLNLDQVMKAKEGSVKGLTGGIAHLFKKNGVTRVEGHGSLAGPNKDWFITRCNLQLPVDFYQER